MLLPLLAVCAYLMPAIINGHPFLFPDTLGYNQAGVATLSVISNAQVLGGDKLSRTAIDPMHDGVQTARSPYYGVAVTLAERLNEWLLPLAQAALAVTVILLAARHFGVSDRLQRWLLAIVLGTAAGVAVFASTIMPDLFAAFAVLSIALLLTRYSRLGAVERIFWMVLLLYSCLVHRSHLAVAILLACVALLFRGRIERKAWLPVVGMLSLAAIGHWAVDFTVSRVTGKPPVTAPFLLARMVGDGTVKPYLEQACRTRHFELCRYQNRLPMSENEFLWGRAPGLLMTVPQDSRNRIIREANQVTTGAALARPIQQLRISVQNAFRQLLVVGATEFEQTSGLEAWRSPSMGPALEAYKGSQVMRGHSLLGAWSWAVIICYFLSWLAFYALLIGKPNVMRTRDDASTTRLLVVIGVVINAGVCGAVSGVFDRYQGRVAWLVPFAVCTYLLSVYSSSAKSQPRIMISDLVSPAKRSRNSSPSGNSRRI
jgi:hypothetical protein